MAEEQGRGGKDKYGRGMITTGWFTSDSQEWATPQKVFDELNAEFHFTLDPCCTHENAKCERHYTKEDDGLTKSWGGGRLDSSILSLHILLCHISDGNVMGMYKLS